MPLSLVTAPQTAVMTTADAKAHLRVSGSDDDAYIAGLVDAARGHLDGQDGILGRALINQTWDYVIDGFPPCGDIHLPLAPLVSVTSITYVDTNGESQTLDSALYAVDTVSRPPRLRPAYNQIWPNTRDQMNAVTVRGVYGYGAAAAALPPGIVHAIKLIVGHLYENREQTTTAPLKTLPAGIEALLAPFTIRRF